MIRGTLADVVRDSEAWVIGAPIVETPRLVRSGVLEHLYGIRPSTRVHAKFAPERPGDANHKSLQSLEPSTSVEVRSSGGGQLLVAPGLPAHQNRSRPTK